MMQSRGNAAASSASSVYIHAHQKPTMKCSIPELKCRMIPGNAEDLGLGVVGCHRRGLMGGMIICFYESLSYK